MENIENKIPNGENQDTQNSSFFSENVSSSNGLEAYPRLRFKAYLDAWNISPLKDLASYGNKRTSVNKRHFISTENMLQNFQGIEQYVDETVVSGVKFEKNDILLANIRPYLRKVWYATFDGAASTDVLAIHTNKQNSLFLKYIIANDKFIDYVMGAAKGSKMPRGDKNFIMDYKVGYPSLPEQQKIANFLSLVDQRIEKQRQLVEALKKYKRGLLSAIFDRKIRFKDDNGNNFPDWELKTVADVLNYEQPQKYIVFSENYNDEYKTPVLTANKAFILGYTNEETGVYSKGETIIYDDFTMDFKFVDFSFKVKSSTIKMLTCKNFNDLYFMYNLLLSLNLMPQSHQRSYISILEPTKIFVPCYDEQLIISKVLRKVDSYVDQHNKYLDTLEKCKKGLLQRMFI